MSVCVSPIKLFADEADHITVEENRVDGDLITKETHFDSNNNIQYVLIFVENDELSTCFNSLTGEIVNIETGEVVAVVNDEENVIEDNATQTPRSYNYGGVTVADRWTYSYSSNSTITCYNGNVTIIFNSIRTVLENKGARQLARAVLLDIAESVLSTAYAIHGSNAEVVHRVQTRKYANRYVMSDFACIYEELDELYQNLGVTGYDQRITSNNG